MPSTNPTCKRPTSCWSGGVKAKRPDQLLHLGRQLSGRHPNSRWASAEDDSTPAFDKLGKTSLGKAMTQSRSHLRNDVINARSGLSGAQVGGVGSALVPPSRSRWACGRG